MLQKVFELNEMMRFCAIYLIIMLHYSSMPFYSLSANKLYKTKEHSCENIKQIQIHKYIYNNNSNNNNNQGNVYGAVIMT